MIKLKTKEEIRVLHEGGRILAQILKNISAKVKPGTNTEDLEKFAIKLIKEAGGRPSFLDYKTSSLADPYPTALCVSINNEVVHAPALPGRLLQAGDIVGLDIGMEYPFKKNQPGLYTDMAVTLPVGKVNEEVEKLLNVTKKSLLLAIRHIEPGVSINKIGGIIEDYVEAHGFGVVRQLVGHGVGYAPHEDPQVPNYRAGKAYNIILKPGMVLAVEPMVNMGGWEIETGDDGFTIITSDGSLSAHFEHSIAVTKKGCLVLTA